MLKIRLRRQGKKKQASFRVVVADSRSPRDGRFVENIGHYNPRTDPPTFAIKEDRALYWLSKGAQPTDAVKRMLDKMGAFEKLQKVHQGIPIEELVAPPEPEIAAEEEIEAEAAIAEAEAIVETTEEAEPAPEVVEAVEEEPDGAEEPEGPEVVEAVGEEAPEEPEGPEVVEAVEEGPEEPEGPEVVEAVEEGPEEPEGPEVVEAVEEEEPEEPEGLEVVEAVEEEPDGAEEPEGPEVVEAVEEEEPEEPEGPEELEVVEAVEEPEAADEDLTLDDITLEDLELSTRSLNVLVDAGLETAQDLLDKLAGGEAEFLSIPGAGGATLDEVREVLVERGLLEPENEEEA